MSAADWRKAMNAGAGRYAWNAGAAGRRVTTHPSPRPSPLRGEGEVAAGAWARWIGRRVGARHVLVLLAVLIYPWVATPFFTYQIGAQSLALGLIALSLTFLAGYGGMVSLAQMTVAGIAGYMYAIFATSGTTEISLRWPWGLAVVLALVIATVCGTLIGWFSVRTEGIYTIMITLAIGVAFYYLAQQNYSLFNGFQGFQSVMTPAVGSVELRAPMTFYYLALFWSLAGYFFVAYLLRAPFGVALQGIRDNPRRMSALGFNVWLVRWVAFVYAGFWAGVAGLLFLYYHRFIGPHSLSIAESAEVLLMVILGGAGTLTGPIVGAAIIVLVRNLISAYVEHWPMLLGVLFLLVIMFVPEGIVPGIASRLRALRASGHKAPAEAPPHT